MSLSFAELGLPAQLVKKLLDQGIESPFPIQESSLPDALAGRDIVGRAPTGSGKTLAFGLALLARTPRAEPYQPRGLVLVPTRELAAQVQKELAQLTTDRGRRIITIYGGTSYKLARRSLQMGTDIIVACPGRLEDLLEQDDLDLNSVTTVIVDEADRMADMGFAPAVRRIMRKTAPNRHVMLFSATLGSEVRSLVEEFTHNPAVHDVVGDAAPSEVDHHFWVTGKDDRVETVASLVAEHGRSIVFCKTKHGADRLAHQLEQRGIEAVAIHGDRTQAQREKALAAVISGRADVLVATDVAARGIHIDALPCVIHYDLPQANDDYIHRSGRTGRAGETGLVVSIVLPDMIGKTKRMMRDLGFEPKVVKRADAEAQRLTPPTEKMRPLVGKAQREEIPMTLADIRAIIDAEVVREDDRPARREDRDRGDRRPQSRDRADRGPRAPRRDFGDRDRAPRGDRPSFRDDRPARSDFGPREDRPARSEFAPRTDRAPRGDRPAFRDDRAPRGDRPSFRDDRAPRGDRPSFRDDHAPRREFADRAPRGDRPEGGSVGRDGGPTATVSFFNEAKGYGFAIDREGQELFIHSSQIMDRNLRGLRKGQKVTVDVAKGPKGLEARNVRVLESRGSRF